MLRKVVQRARNAVAFEIFRCAAYNTPVLCQAHRDETGVDHTADTDAQVIAFPHQVDHLVGQVEGQLHVRIGGQKARRVRCNMLAPERGRRGHDQVARGLVPALRNIALRDVHIREQLAAILQEHIALLSQRLVARGAVHQFHAEAFLQRINSSPKHDRRDVLFQRRTGEAALLDHGHEGLDLLQFVHDFDYSILKVSNETIFCRLISGALRR